jgi:hypothetical protein
MVTERPALAQAADLPPEVGYNYAEIEMPRAAGVAGAERALGSSVSALFLNPANMRRSRVYHLGAFTQLWPEAGRYTYGAAAVDSILNSAGLAGGIGGTWNVQDADGIDRRYTDVRGGLALPAGDALLVGIGARYFRAQQNGLGPLGASVPSSGLHDDEIVHALTFDAGITVQPSDELALALVGNNLNVPGHGFLPTSLGGGIGYGTKTLAAEADVVADFTTYADTTYRLMVGGEYLLGSFPLRAGYRYDRGQENHSLSLGVGYVDPRFGFELSVRRVIEGPTATAVTIGFTYHLEAVGLGPTQADTF